MKLYVHFENEYKGFTYKLNIDDSMKVSDVINKFIELYRKNDDMNRPVLSESSSRLSLDNKTFLDNDAIAKSVFKDGDDVYIIRDKEKVKIEKTCAHNGCKKKFTDETNTYNSCQYHPQGPIFHEGMKGWQCCSKRVISFDEFMTIPGCSFGPHSEEEEKKEDKKKTQQDEKEKFNVEVKDGVETFTSKDQPKQKKEEVVIRYGQKIDVKDYIVEEPDDPLDAPIKVGTKCRHNGCDKTFVNDESRTEPCIYHPGQPVFHEASKYWSCCKPRCAEFEQFLKIKGCKVGRHKFLPPKDEEGGENRVNCRYDYYQYGDYVVSCIYAKEVDHDKTKIKFEDKYIDAHVIFKNGKEFKKRIELYAEIDPEKSTYSILSTKIEMKLLKKAPINWPSLEPQLYTTIVKP